MNAYSGLAPFYDELTRDVDHGAFLRFYERVFDIYGLHPKSVLDLGCGTGTLTCLMAGRGYDMIGTDSSEDMLSIANNKALSLDKKDRPLFLSQPMEELDLYGTVDAAVCCLDGINYLSRESLCETLRRLHLFLEPGGLFIFDINTPEKLLSLDGEAFVDETDDLFCVWRAEYDESCSAVRYGFDLFSRVGDSWDRSFEEHVEYLYSGEYLLQALSEFGFGDFRLFDGREDPAPAQNEGRLFIAARNLRGKE